jgi:hypothetical protein
MRSIILFKKDPKKPFSKCLEIKTSIRDFYEFPVFAANEKEAKRVKTVTNSTSDERLTQRGLKKGFH